MELPTVTVLDAFTSGGAQQAGGRTSTTLEWATNVDWARSRHAIRLGSLVEGGRYLGDTRTNYLGTFTFASLADYDAGRPTTFSRRAGNPLVEYSHWQAGVFVQDDWRVRKNLTLSGGVRQELQTHLDDPWNVSPRVGLTWSPFKSGRTTIRGGGGIFHDWLDADTFEQTIRVDGVHQQDLVTRDPGYPDPSRAAARSALPPSRYQLASGLVMPERVMLTAGVSQQITPAIGLNLSVNHSNGRHRFRGRNVNAPLDGVRPDPAFGNVTQVESTARSANDSINAGFNGNFTGRRTMVFANYSWIRQRNDADGPFSLPTDSYDLSGEWGPTTGVPHHVFSGMVNTTLPRGVRLGVTATARTGSPYNVTTGRDDNGDTVFTDRPAGVGRNSATSAGMWDVAARVSYAFGFGDRQAAAGGAGGQTVIVQRLGGGGSASDLLGAMPGGGAESKRIRVELYLSASNVLNHTNPIGYSGVMTSPFFGEPTAAMPARRLDMGVRIGF